MVGLVLKLRGLLLIPVFGACRWEQNAGKIGCQKSSEVRDRAEARTSNQLWPHPHLEVLTLADRFGEALCLVKPLNRAVQADIPGPAHRDQPSRVVGVGSPEPAQFAAQVVDPWSECVAVPVRQAGVAFIELERGHPHAKSSAGQRGREIIGGWDDFAECEGSKRLDNL
ncbi:MAG: hypothetical protein ABSF67_10300 [Roseiarcus sp.]